MLIKIQPDHADSSKICEKNNMEELHGALSFGH